MLPSIRVSNPYAVSDGAGGVGIFSSEWSRFICKSLPEEPIQSVEEFRQWLTKIWQPFCDNFQPVAESKGLAYKFLNEGSYATIVAVWISTENLQANWLAYGDSTLFVFNTKTEKLTLSTVPDILSFSESPYLINWNIDYINNDAFNTGIFKINQDNLIILASDAMAQLILLRYLFWRRDEWSNTQLEQLENSGTRLSNFYGSMKKKGREHFFHEFIPELKDSLATTETFRKYTNRQRFRGLLNADDYSVILMDFDE